GSVALIRVADAIIDRGRKIAAAHFEADPKQIKFEDGVFQVTGADNRHISIKEVARLSFRMRPDLIGDQQGLSEKRIVAPAGPTFPNGCHICEVEIDPDTGLVEFTRYAICDDVGRIINPLLVKGQIHGGVVQGLGQVLLENIAYDENGQLLSGSFMDYAMPRASDMPDILSVTNQVV